MIRLKMGLVVALLVGSCEAHAIDCQSAATTQALAKWLQAVDASWVSRDAKAMAALYTQDADLKIEPNIANARGRAAIEHTFSAMFQQVPTRIQHKMTLQHVTAVGNYCVADTRADMVLTTGNGKQQLVQQLAATWLLQPSAEGMRAELVRAHDIPLKTAG